jgi:hypothetical protein
MKASNAELVALVAGEVSVEALAARHGVSQADVSSWRAAFVEGMRAGAAGRSGARRLNPRWAVAAIVLGSVAFAQLTTFTANSPAVASQVNANFTQLKTWLEQKVGVAGTAAVTITGGATITGATNITGATAVTGTLSTSGALSPERINFPYAPWGAVQGAGGASIVNENAGYKALMLAGNNAAGGVRKIQLYDDVYVEGELTVKGFSGPAYEMECAEGESGINYGYCCRLNKKTGVVNCKYSPGGGSGWGGWSAAADAFAGGTDAPYSLTCTAHKSGVVYPLCCRTGASGAVSCVYSGNNSVSSWSAAVSPF